jgi:hypothetical protein
LRSHRAVPAPSLSLSRSAKIKMRWSFTVSEESASHFQATAKRITGDSISISGGDEIFARILKEAYDAEMKHGTFHGDAAYQITTSFLKSWPTVYFEKMFGCWTVGDRSGFPRIDYDGRDFYLMVSETPDAYSWQGNIDSLAKGRCGYFEKLVALSEKHGA